MSILSDLAPNPGRPCRIGTLLLTLSATDAEILAKALDDINTWSPRALSKALNDRGLTLSRDTIVSHRTGVCRCSKI